MNEIVRENKVGLLFLGVSLAVGFIITALIVVKSLERLKLANENITVKGFAEKQIISDVAVWKSKVITRSNDSGAL